MGADVVQASRYVIGGGTLKWRWRRHFQSRVANLLWRTLLGSPRDSTTNFRVFNKRAAQLVVEKSIGRDFEFMPECILIAMSHGLRIVEVPIIFTGRAAGGKQARPGAKRQMAIVLDRDHNRLQASNR